MRPTIAPGILLTVLLTACGTIPAPDPTITEPDPNLNPVDVVEAQLDAFRAPGDGRHGIEIAYRFITPAWRREIGTVDRYAELFEHGANAGLLDHRDAEVFRPTVRGDLAIVPTRVMTSDGERIDFVFVLTRERDEPYENMWLTDDMQVHSTEDPASEQSDT